jgi:hypothetical protein
MNLSALGPLPFASEDTPRPPIASQCHSAFDGVNIHYPTCKTFYMVSCCSFHLKYAAILAGRSFERSRTKYGFEPWGNVKRSNPARLVDVASILILLSRVDVKYPGEASSRQVRQCPTVCIYRAGNAPSVSFFRKRSRLLMVVVQLSNPCGQSSGMISKFP